MKKREQGILSVEASIVLTLCTLFILFLFSFARLYSAQSQVSHAVLQSSDAIALESYLRENTLHGDEADVVELANRLTGSTTVSADSFTSLRSADIPKVARDKFIYAIADSEAKADAKLKSLGVKDGINGVDFSYSKMDLGNDDIIVYAKYTIEMQFPVFGMKEIAVTKAAKAKTFGDILFEIQTVAKDPHTGSATGGGNFKHGTQIQISATPNYGYKFSKWEDGNTDNPRTVTVNGAKKYVAVFIEDQFGVNTNVDPSDGGTVSGGGTYNYLSTQTVTANPNAGYHFTKWSIYKHKDRTTSIINNTPSHTVTVDQSYTCTAYFEPNNYTVSTKCSGGPSDSYAKVVIGGSTKQSATATYKSSFKITAPADVGDYKFIGWKIEGTSNYISTSTSADLTVPAKNVTYVACYKNTRRTVRFYNGDNSLFATVTVREGNSLGSKMPTGTPYKVGYRFNRWNNFDANTKVWSDTNVYGNWYKCGSHKYGHCGVKHYLDYPGTWYVTDSHLWEAHWVSWASCTRCIYCKKQGSYRVLCGTHWEKGTRLDGNPRWGSYATYVGANPCGSYNLP